MKFSFSFFPSFLPSCLSACLPSFLPSLYLLAYLSHTVICFIPFLFFVRTLNDHPLPTIWWEEFRQYANHVCSEQEPLSHFKRLQMGIFGFSQKETRAKTSSSKFNSADLQRQFLEIFIARTDKITYLSTMTTDSDRPFTFIQFYNAITYSIFQFFSSIAAFC